MVEFALVLLPLLVVVVGIVQFGIGLNYWLDLNRIANQGARWAVVNGYPGCDRTGAGVCTNPTLQQYLACEPVVSSLAPTVVVSFPAAAGGAGGDERGDPVRVVVSTQFDFVPFLELGTITLRGTAEMRMEQDRSRYSAGGNAPWPCDA
jgi:hypothetical protein